MDGVDPELFSNKLWEDKLRAIEAFEMAVSKAPQAEDILQSLAAPHRQLLKGVAFLAGHMALLSAADHEHKLTEEKAADLAAQLLIKKSTAATWRELSKYSLQRFAAAVWAEWGGENALNRFREHKEELLLLNSLSHPRRELYFRIRALEIAGTKRVQKRNNILSQGEIAEYDKMRHGFIMRWNRIKGHLELMQAAGMLMVQIVQEWKLGSSQLIRRDSNRR